MAKWDCHVADLAMTVFGWALKSSSSKNFRNYMILRLRLLKPWGSHLFSTLFGAATWHECLFLKYYQRNSPIEGRLGSCPAWAYSIGWKSRTAKGIVVVSLRQGCPPWGGIWRKPAANLRPEEHEPQARLLTSGWACPSKRNPDFQRCQEYMRQVDGETE